MVERKETNESGNEEIELDIIDFFATNRLAADRGSRIIDTLTTSPNLEKSSRN